MSLRETTGQRRLLFHLQHPLIPEYIKGKNEIPRGKPKASLLAGIFVG
jgi:hypothetical protein